MKAYVWHFQHEMIYKAAYRMRVKNMITTRHQRSLSVAGLHIEFSSQVCVVLHAADAIGAKKNQTCFFSPTTHDQFNALGDEDHKHLHLHFISSEMKVLKSIFFY